MPVVRDSRATKPVFFKVQPQTIKGVLEPDSASTWASISQSVYCIARSAVWKACKKHNTIHKLFLKEEVAHIETGGAVW